MLKIRKYKGFEIHYTLSQYKYDIYDRDGRWFMSFNKLADVKEYINHVLWSRANIPF